jgi:hypothetical protein
MTFGNTLTHDRETRTLDHGALDTGVSAELNVLLVVLAEDFARAKGFDSTNGGDDLLSDSTTARNKLKRFGRKLCHRHSHDATGDHDDRKDGSHRSSKLGQTSIRKDETSNESGDKSDSNGNLFTDTLLNEVAVRLDTSSDLTSSKVIEVGNLRLACGLTEDCSSWKRTSCRMTARRYVSRTRRPWHSDV